MRSPSSSRHTPLIVGVITFVVIGGFQGLRALVGPEIRGAHTEFLFSQIDSEFRPTNAVSTIAELADHLSRQPIDWNSCSLTDATILDGWGQEVRLTAVYGNGLELRSAGVDRIFGTTDDITKRIEL